MKNSNILDDLRGVRPGREYREVFKDMPEIEHRFQSFRDFLTAAYNKDQRAAELRAQIFDITMDKSICLSKGEGLSHAVEKPRDPSLGSRESRGRHKLRRLDASMV